MPDKSSMRDRQNAISSSGPPDSSAVDAPSWLLVTTTLICRVHRITVDSSRRTRSLSAAASCGSSRSSPGR